MVRILSRPDVAERDAEDTVPNQTAPGEAPSRTARTVQTDRAGLVPVQPRWTHVSAGATLGLVLGLTGLYATLTGMLVPLGVALGVIGLLVTAGGFAAARRDAVTGHSLAMLGMLTSAAALVLGVLAITGTLPWLNPHADTIPQVRDWLNLHLPWLRHW